MSSHSGSSSPASPCEASARPGRAGEGVRRRGTHAVAACVAAAGLALCVWKAPGFGAAAVLGEGVAHGSAAMAHVPAARIVDQVHGVVAGTSLAHVLERRLADGSAGGVLGAAQHQPTILTGAGEALIPHDWAREPKRELEFGRTEMAGELRGFMLSIDPRIDSHTDGREVLNEALIFLFLCSAVFCAMKAFDAFGGRALLRPRPSRERPPPPPESSHHSWWNQHVSDGFFFGPITPSPPLLFILGFSGGAPMAAATATAAFPILFPRAHHAAARLFPAAAAAGGVVVLLLFVGPGAPFQVEP
ncbi:hypothetical protein T484DRAFT_3573409 [Baffinella frigidus]|nr:hypothetical protein T484DRAFT_3573409 [Cryptophyta sp. CCMP2293]